MPKRVTALTGTSIDWPWPKVSSMQALMRMANARRGPLWPATPVAKQQPCLALPPCPAERAQERIVSEKTMAKPSTTAGLKQRLWPGLGLPPAKRRRWDLPRRESTAKVANTSTDDTEASTAVLDDTYTASSRRSVSARIGWWERAAKKRWIAPFPLEHGKLTLAGALLKQGKYKSASQYLHSIKKEHLRRGHAWPEQLSVQLNDLRRSCARGLGGPCQADAFCLEAHTVNEPFCFHSVPHAAEAIIVGTRWLLREIELAALQVKDVTLQTGHGCGRATILIGPDKVNTKGKKCPRSLDCNCPDPTCPVAAVKVLLAAAKTRADSREEYLVCTATRGRCFQVKDC